MIEISRYVLAAIVAQTHLWPRGADWMGQISVFAFYTLSGYLMTRVLNERYGFSAKGTAAFLLNRVLRLWPAYLVVIAIVAVALLFFPLASFYPLIRVPRTALEIVSNLAIFGQVTFDFVQWSPMAKLSVTSWSLAIELFCYVLLGVYFARTPARLWMLALIGALSMALSTAWCVAAPDPAAYGPYCFQNRYGVLQAGFIPFGAGGLFYFYRRGISEWIVSRRRWLFAALSTGLVLMFLGPVVNATIGPFIGIAAMYCLLAVSDDAKPSTVEDFIGRASYHLFIAHMPLAAILATGLHFRANRLPLFVATIVAALALSVFLVRLERRVETIRAGIVARI